MKIIFAGTPDFAVPALKMLLQTQHEICAVYTQPDRPAGRGRKLTPSPVKVEAVSGNVPVYQPENFKSTEDISKLASHQADLMVVVAYGIILPQAVLDIPALGCINIHASLLPRWRGAAPIQRAIMAGDRESGVTIMQIIKKLDAGDMMHKEICSIKEDQTSAQLHDELAQLGAVALIKVLQQLKSGTVQKEQQDESFVTYAEKIEKSEARIDWFSSAIELDRKIRGLNSWPVAQTRLGGKVLKIWLARPVSESSDLEPGSVFLRDKDVFVVTGDGLLQLLLVQLPGGKPMDTGAFLNAHTLDGMVLG